MHIHDREAKKVQRTTYIMKISIFAGPVHPEKQKKAKEAKKRVGLARITAANALSAKGAAVAAAPVEPPKRVF